MTTFIPLFQGETKTSSNEDEAFTTILGSCIAACVWDPVARVGGMNHFLLPGGQGEGEMHYGANAMEILINDLLKKGAVKRRMRAKVFGGAKMISSASHVGSKNAKFIMWFMENEGIVVEDTCLEGLLGRKVRFWPTSGRAQRSFLSQGSSELEVAEAAPVKVPEQTGDVDLF